MSTRIWRYQWWSFPVHLQRIYNYLNKFLGIVTCMYGVGACINIKRNNKIAIVLWETFDKLKMDVHLFTISYIAS